MSDTPPNSVPPVISASRVVAGICLILPLVGLMWVDSYSRMTPKLLGIPFFYWYQMLWVPIAASLTFTAYVLIKRDERARRGGAGQ